MKEIHYEVIGSTNDVAKELANNGEGEGTVVTADIQTNGRGRMGRNWITPNGNFSGSFIIEGKSIKENPELSFLVGVAVVDALKYLVPEIKCLCKWPNDIMLNGHKVCGILLEMAENNKIIAGIGINLQSHPNDSETSYPTTSILKSAYKLISQKEMCESLMQSLNKNLRIWREIGFLEIRKKWLCSAYKINETITVKQMDKTFSGVFKTIDETGRLILIDAFNNEIKINVGDVIYGKQ